jgi:hypothetical protein
VGLVDGGVVDVGSVDERDPPPRHGQRIVEPRGFAERALGVAMVEGEGPHQALIEGLLRLGVGGRDRSMVRAQVERHIAGGGRGRLGGRRARRGSGKGKQTEDGERARIGILLVRRRSIRSAREAGYEGAEGPLSGPACARRR